MDKKPVVLYKTLVIEVILIFIGVAISPIITAIDYDTNTSDESTNGIEIDLLDDYDEIVTWIGGSGHIYVNQRLGFLLWDIDINRCGIHGGPNLFGLRHSNDSIEIYSERDLSHVHVPRFRGFLGEPQIIMGIALGNIEW